MKERMMNKHNDYQRQVDEIIQLSSLLDVSVSEMHTEKTNYLDVDLILKTPISEVKAKKHSLMNAHTHAKKEHERMNTKAHNLHERIQEKNHKIMHPRREKLIHFHAHVENHASRPTYPLFSSLIYFLKKY